VSLGIFGSRMKDFYDIWFLTKNRDFDKKRLSEAIVTTFSKRKTDFEEINRIFEDDFIQDSNKAKQWKAFLRRTSLTEQVTFENVMNDLKGYFSEGLDLPLNRPIK
jgi:hypothetical protein